jgi:hypothetical protein
MYLRDEEQLVYEQTRKDCRSSHPGGTSSGCERRWCALGQPASLRTPSLVVRSVDEKHLGFGEEINEKSKR